jgi:hypothetical protein
MEASALKEQGYYPSPGNSCTAALNVSAQGGFLQLSVKNIPGKLIHTADDITGLLWIDDNTLVYSSSPIYGKPGIFEVKCDSKSLGSRILVDPKNINSAYPDGADYFELKEVKGQSLQFYYGTDVDSIDFNIFRSEKYLKSLTLP